MDGFVQCFIAVMFSYQQIRWMVVLQCYELLVGSMDGFVQCFIAVMFRYQQIRQMVLLVESLLCEWSVLLGELFVACLAGCFMDGKRDVTRET